MTVLSSRCADQVGRILRTTGTKSNLSRVMDSTRSNITGLSYIMLPPVVEYVGYLVTTNLTNNTDCFIDVGRASGCEDSIHVDWSSDSEWASCWLFETGRIVDLN
jgi:hypothetical protein